MTLALSAGCDWVTRRGARPGMAAGKEPSEPRRGYTRATMNKLVTWLGTGTMAVTLWACGGKVIVGGGNAGNGGAGGGGEGGSITTGSGASTCGDVDLPSPADLMVCGGSVSAGSGGMTTCEQDFCDVSGNIFASVCTGSACACVINGQTKCSCATTSTNDICSTGSMPSCCPWVPIPL
jgi:hypothetical protein